MKRIILTAAAAAAVLMGSVAAAAPAFASNGPASISARYYNPSGRALGGPQPVALGSEVPFGSAALAKITEKMNNANINGATITITGTVDPASINATDVNGGYPPVGPNMRLYFQGSSGGVTTGSPDGYEGQEWWADGSGWSLNTQTGVFSLTATVSPSGWSDWNGQPASLNAGLFTGSASHVREVGLSFGGGYFFENGVAGPGGVTISNITVSS